MNSKRVLLSRTVQLAGFTLPKAVDTVSQVLSASCTQSARYSTQFYLLLHELHMLTGKTKSTQKMGRQD